MDDILSVNDVTIPVLILTGIELIVVILLECSVDYFSQVEQVDDLNLCKCLCHHNDVPSNSQEISNINDNHKKGEDFAIESMIHYKMYFIGISALISVRCVLFIFRHVGQEF